MKKFLHKYRHAWTLLYVFIYMAWFMWLERTITPDTPYTNIHVWIDDYIPFCEWFIIPYVLWFLYIPLVMGFVFFTSRSEFYKASAYMFIGMSICLFICTVWPNGQDLRMDEFTRNNICTRIISFIYTADTNTNVFPSIHVFNSVGAVILIFKNHILKKYKWVKIGSIVLSTLIILSTMFLNQHSIVDVIGGLVLGAIMYLLVYGIKWSKIRKKLRRRRK